MKPLLIEAAGERRMKIKWNRHSVCFRTARHQVNGVETVPGDGV